MQILKRSILLLTSLRYVPLGSNVTYGCPHFVNFLRIGSWQKYLEQAAALEGISTTVPVYKVTEGNEPFIFTKYFNNWDPVKAEVSGSIKMIFVSMLPF